MDFNDVSCSFSTEKVQETRDFYVKYLGARVIFDCGWYVNLELGGNVATIQFMSPQRPEHQLSSSAGLTYNFNVADVDAEYKRLAKENVEIAIPLEDHPWGDRGFGIKDPNGITLYIYSEIDPSEEYQKFYKSNE